MSRVKELLLLLSNVPRGLPVNGDGHAPMGKAKKMAYAT